MGRCLVSALGPLTYIILVLQANCSMIMTHAPTKKYVFLDIQPNPRLLPVLVRTTSMQIRTWRQKAKITSRVKTGKTVPKSR